MGFSLADKSNQNKHFMKAMILAAGLGTRLRPLTNDRPKAMVRIQGIPLLEIVIRRLQFFGIREFIINTHHFADQITGFLKEKENFGATIHISYEAKEPLETGGALKKAKAFFADGDPFLLCNTDILTTLDFYAFFQYHKKNKAMATLATRQRATSRYLIFDEKNTLSGWTNIKTGELKMARPVAGKFQLRAFSGLHVIDPALFQYFGKEHRFSIIDTYLAAAERSIIKCYPDDDSIWLDVGKTPAIEAAGRLVGQVLKNNIENKFRD